MSERGTLPERGPVLSIVPGGEPSAGRVTVVGILGEELEGIGREAQQALATAGWIAGGRRHLDAWRRWVGTAAARELRAKSVPTVELSGDAEAFAHEVAHRAVDQQADVCVLASGDPGFFGVLRSLLRVVERSRVRVLPAPSSVAVAFARLGLPWDDAVVVSAQGGPVSEAVRVLRLAPKAAVLTCPDAPPQAVARALLDAGLSMDLVALCSRLGYPDEEVLELTLDELARGSFDPLSVVVLVGPGGLQPVGWGDGITGAGAADDRATEEHAPDGLSRPERPGAAPQSVARTPDPGAAVIGIRPGVTGPGRQPTIAKVLAWGLPDHLFAHRGPIVTRAEVRAAALGKLELPSVGVVWDVGAGTGSVAIECARLCPGLTVFAIEQDPDDAGQVSANAADHGAAVHVVAAPAPAAFESLPDPDRAFVGGGGIEVLDAVLRRLRPEGRVVATYAALDRAAAAAQRLGNLTQIAVSAGELLPDGGWRLAAQNPVFVAWGPR